MGNKYKIRFLQMIFFLAFCASIFLDPVLLFVSLGIYCFLEIFIGNATLHRFYGHKSFTMNPYFIPFARWLCHHIGVGSVIGWVGHHRLHHLHSDTIDDIHSPKYQGIVHILFKCWDVNIPRSLIKDVLSDKNLVWWHRNYFTYHFVVGLCLILVDIKLFIYVYCVPNFFCLLSGYILAIVPHVSGRAENSIMADIVTFGEGWHKFHHDNPNEFLFSKWDLTGLAIWIFLKK